MFRYPLLILLFIIGSSSLLHGGGWFSRPNKEEPPKGEKAVNNSNGQAHVLTNEFAPYQKELTTYLEGLKLEDFTTQVALREYLHTTVNSDLRDDSKFPLFTAFMKNLEDTQNNDKAYEAGNALAETIQQFIKQKNLPYRNSYMNLKEKK